MKKATQNLRIILSAGAVLFIALSPLIHGLHLVLSSHTHNYCSNCIDSTAVHCHNKSHSHQGCATGIHSASGEDGSGEHDPDTCPLCRQLNQLLKKQIVLQSPAVITLQDSPPEKQFGLSDYFSCIRFHNILPRAPPAC